MQIHIWQQFAANHSNHFTVVGEFATHEAAQRATIEIREALRTLFNWHHIHEGEWDKNPLSRSTVSPPELEIAQKYDIEWTRHHEWIEDIGVFGRGDTIAEKAAIALGHFVLFDSSSQASVGPEPFNDIIGKLGASRVLAAAEGHSTCLVTHIECSAPDEAIAQTICNTINQFMIAYDHFQASFTQNQLQLEIWFVGDLDDGITTKLPTIVMWLREQGCKDVELRFEIRRDETIEGPL